MKKIFVSVLALFAAGALQAQDLTAIYNEAATAFGAKQYAAAAAGFEKVIDQGTDVEGAESTVNAAKQNLPTCYYQLGGAAFMKKEYDNALESFTKSLEYAQLYGNAPAEAKAKTWIANVYSNKGGDAFNNNDFATAAEVFAKGYEFDPRNTTMALNLAMSYCELGEFEKGMEVYDNVIALSAKNPKKYADALATANEKVNYYTMLKVADLQKAGDNDGIIAMADNMLAQNADNAVAHKVRLDAYNAKKDYAKVIELGEAAAAAQTDEEAKSTVYYTLGLAYNAKEMKPQAIEALKKVTAGPAVDSAKAALAELTK